MLSSGILNRAINIANNSPFDRWKVGAVIFKNNKIISYANNRRRNHKNLHPNIKQLLFQNNVHAEINAIFKAKKDLKNCDILVIRIIKDMSLRCARPCAVCLYYVKKVGINNIYYSTENNTIESISTKDYSFDFITKYMIRDKHIRYRLYL